MGEPESSDRTARGGVCAWADATDDHGYLHVHGRGRQRGERSFTIHVRGAGEQIVRLIDKTLADLDRPALGPALRAELQAAAALAGRDPRLACSTLSLYITTVRLAPTPAFTPTERTDLIADATRIRAVIGCRPVTFVVRVGSPP